MVFARVNQTKAIYDNCINNLLSTDQRNYRLYLKEIFFPISKNKLFLKRFLVDKHHKNLQEFRQNIGISVTLKI